MVNPFRFIIKMRTTILGQRSPLKGPGYEDRVNPFRFINEIYY